MYSLIKARLASMEELKTVYTLDEALKLYALHCMEQDIEAGRPRAAANPPRRGWRTDDASRYPDFARV